MKGWTEDDIEQDGSEVVVPAKEYDSAVAIDPGTTTGVAVRWKDGKIRTHTRSFWEVVETGDIRIAQLSNPVYIVEAPYLSKFGKTYSNSARAYDSGRVAREAELLVEGLERKGLDVIEHDPHSSGNSDWTEGKDGAEFIAHDIIGEWEGPDNEHTRDAIRMLFIYNFI